MQDRLDMLEVIETDLHVGGCLPFPEDAAVTVFVVVIVVLLFFLVVLYLVVLFRKQTVDAREEK